MIKNKKVFFFCYNLLKNVIIVIENNIELGGISERCI